MRSLRVCVALVVMAALLLACSSEGPTPLNGYRLASDRMLHVRAVTNPNFSTWVESIEETPANVVISLVTRSGGFEAPATEEIWIAIPLKEPLGNRVVLNANGHTPIARIP